MEWISANWPYVMVVFYALEKIALLTKTTKDDLIIAGIKRFLLGRKPT